MSELMKLLEALDEEIPGILDAWDSCEDGAVVALRVLEWAGDDAHQENEELYSEVMALQAEVERLRAAARLAYDDLKEYEYTDLPGGYAVMETVRALRSALGLSYPDDDLDCRDIAV